MCAAFFVHMSINTTWKRVCASRRQAYSPAMLVEQTYHPHFSPFQRMRAQCRIPGPRTSPFSRSCHDDRPAQPASDRQVAYFVVEPVPARGLDQRALADHLNGPCHIVCVQEGSGFVIDNTMQVNFYVVTQHSCAVLLNKDTFEYNISCTPFQVPCSLRCASWAVQGMAVTGEFRGSPWIFSGPAPLMSCPRWFSLNRVLTSLS